MATSKVGSPVDESKWPYDNCPFIFTKYIKDKKQDTYDVAKEIDFVFKDISIQFDLDDYEDLLKEAKQSLDSEMFVAKKEFEQYLCEWIMMFKEEVSSNFITECLDIIQERYEESATEIAEIFKGIPGGSNGKIKVTDFAKFIEAIIPILEVRIINLSAKKPKSDENVCTENDEKEFFEAITAKAKDSGHNEIDIPTSEKILIEYFKGIDAKYCFTPFKTYDDNNDIDPFADLGEDNPFAAKKKAETQQDQTNIDETQRLIEEAERDGINEKVKLLKKVKHFQIMKKDTRAQKDRENIDLMISGIKKEIRDLDNENQKSDRLSPNLREKEKSRMSNAPSGANRYGEFVEDDDNGAYNKDLYSESENYYDGQQHLEQSSKHKTPSPYPDERMKASSKQASKLESHPRSKQGPGRFSEEEMEEEKRLEAEPVESLEDKRQKGVKEIFDFYTRQHLMVGKKATFEQIEYELSNLNMGEFMRFCKDFKIPVSKTRCAEVFKKTAKNSKEMFLEHFQESFAKLIAMRNKEELEGLEKRLKEVKKCIIKRKRKLEVDDTPDEESKHPQSAASQKRDVSQDSDHNQRAESREQNSKLSDRQVENKPDISKDQKKAPLKTETFKAKGGDPHGALQKLEQQQLEELRNEMAAKEGAKKVSYG